MGRDEDKARLAEHAERLRAMRSPAAQDGRFAAALVALRRWQAGRLALTFDDLLASPRHRAAAEFFLTDLYGEQDASWRDRDLARAMGMLTRWLPAALLGTLADAVELDYVSHELDERVARAALAEGVDPAAMDIAGYARAYRVAGNLGERSRQLDLLMKVGVDLDRVVRLPFVGGLLHLAKLPAEGAGMGSLHTFLERGFAAFRSMGGAREFLGIIDARERSAMQRLLAGEPEPFGPGFDARWRARQGSGRSG